MRNNNNYRIIILKKCELKKSKKFLIKGLDNYRKISESNIKENNELKNDIEKFFYKIL